MGRVEDDLKGGTFAKCYLLYGEETYLINYYKKEFRRKLLAPDDTFNINVFTGKEAEANAIMEQARTMPFFAPKRLILVEDSGLFTKSGDALAEFLKECPEETVIVFVEGELETKAKTSKLYKSLKDHGVLQEYKHPDEATLTRWALRRLQKAGKQITRSAMSYFFLCAGDDMECVSNELDKVMAYTYGRDSVTKEDVEAVCRVRSENRIFDMLDALAVGDSRTALKLYNDLISLKEPPSRIIYMITRQFNMILQVKDLREQGFDKSTIMSRTGYKAYPVGVCLRQASLFTLDKLKRTLSLCADTEQKIKTGDMAEGIAAEMLIVRIAGGKRTRN